MSTEVLSHWTQSYSSELLPQGPEPEWMNTLRRQAWEIWLDMPEPPAPQRNLRKLPVLKREQLQPARPVIQSDQAMNQRQQSWGQAAAKLLSSNGSARAELSQELIDQGVIVLSLSEALNQYPELVRKHFGSVFPAVAAKDIALNLAYWQSGYFVYVPRNLQLELPVYSLQSLLGSNQALFQRSLVVVESGARLSLIHDSYSETQEAGSSLLSDVLELVVGDGAQVNALYLQQLGREVHCQAYSQAHLGRDARYSALNISLGSCYHFAHSAVTLDKAGAEAKLLGLFVAQGDQHFRQTSLQNHLAPHTSSHLQYHSVLRDQAYSFYNGMIYVDGLAQQTESNQLSKSLLLSDDARADAIPNLEILADDVQSGHGAAIGSLDAEQLFYLQSRGFDHEIAENMLVEGFMEEVILQFPDQALQPLIKEHLSLRLLDRDEDRDEDAADAEV